MTSKPSSPASAARAELALFGGAPVRARTLPYGRQTIDPADRDAVLAVLDSDWLTTGPAVEAFETAFAKSCAARHAVAVSSGTAALEAACFALALGPGDEVIVPSLTFASTANAVLSHGATPVFADVDPDTLLLTPGEVEARRTDKTRAVIAVDYTGQPCDYNALGPLCDRHGLTLLADACHALGGALADRPVGSLAALSAFSFHPVKPITAGEGGAVTTDDDAWAERMRRFRNHGISTDFRQREAEGSWFYEMIDLGRNYRLTDIQCVLALSQLGKLADWTRRRQAIALAYDTAFADTPRVRPLARRPGVSHAYHLYPVLLDLADTQTSRKEVFSALRAEGIGVNVHYIPVHLHPYYRARFGTGPGVCPVAEAAYERLITLPLFPAMTDADAQDVVTAVRKVLRGLGVAS